MNNKYTWKEALEVAEERLDKEQLLVDDEGTQWDIDNLSEYPEGIEGFVVDDDCYYCVGWDGRIGVTRDNGYNVEWLYKVIN